MSDDATTLGIEVSVAHLTDLCDVYLLAIDRLAEVVGDETHAADGHEYSPIRAEARGEDE